MKNIFLSALMIIGLNLPCFAAQNAADIYLLAQAKNTTELKKVENIDAVDSNGDTALCHAIRDDNIVAYNALKDAGANIAPKCISKIDREKYTTFIARTNGAPLAAKTSGILRNWSWELIGAGALVGGGAIVAATAGGGGSGGHGNSSDETDAAPTPSTPVLPKPDDNKGDDKPATLNCVHGIQNGNTCVCQTGYTGKLCETLDDGYIEQNGVAYPKKNCIHGIQNGNTCVCQTGYTGTLCDTVANGFIEQDGNIYEKLNCVHGTQDKNVCVCDMGYTGTLCDKAVGDDGKEYPKLNCVNGVQQNDICVCSVGYDGTLCDHCINMGTDGKCIIIGKEASINNELIAITNKSDAVIYGLYSETDATNANDSRGIGNIVINNDSDSDVYGLYATKTGHNNSLIDITSSGAGATYGIYVTDNASNSGGTLSINNKLKGNAYGIYSKNTAYNSEGGTININNNSSGNVYGVYAKKTAVNGDMSSNDLVTSSISINNNLTGMAYGLYSEHSASNILLSGISVITIDNNSSGNVYGVYASNLATNVAGNYLLQAKGIINIKNNSDGNAYGIASNGSDGGATNARNGTGIINMANYGKGKAYGVYGKRLKNGLQGTSNNGSGIINIVNFANGNVYGMYSYYELRNETSSDAGSKINIANINSGYAFGAYGTIGTINIYNSGEINIHNLGDGLAVGIYADGAPVTNSGTITIDRTPFTDDNFTDDTSDDVTYTAKSDRGGTAIGIYATSGAKVNNSGTITINGADTAYGIYAESGATVTNTGTISIDGVSCDGTTCAGDATYGNHIVLNGATLFQDGKMVADTLNLNDMGGNVVAGANSQFVVENDLSGTLTASSDIVANGFDTTYTAKNMIQAGDTSKLNLRSGSAMFDAKLADNGNDVVMTMKSFDALTDNKSLAAYLADNYTRGTSAEFFGGLKSGANMAEFNNILNGLSGMNAFTQFDREDMSAMREINFSMNQQMFMNNDRDEYNVSGSMEHFSFSNSSNGGSGSYGISNSRMSDNWKLGYGLAMANIGTNDDLGTSRSNQIGLFYMPMTYTNDNIEFISTPRVGFAKSHYSRRGYNNMNYDGYIEKQIFGFNNDLRYPVTFGNWTIAPDLGFNAIMYRQSGHESDQAFSLIIPADEIYSLEAGFGLFTKYERELSSGGSLRFNSGVMLYRELADTYNMKLGIRGLDGTFNLYDDAKHDYSGAATFGFDYKSGRFSLYSNAQYFMDGDHYMNLKSGIRYQF